MTAKIAEFLRDARPTTPCLVLDLDVVADNYRALTTALPSTRVFYAVKANPGPGHPEVAGGGWLQLRLRLHPGDRHGAESRRHARPNFLRQHH